MRQVKYRGKRIDNGEWVYGYLYELPLESGNACMILTTDNIHKDNSIKPQYHLAFTLWKDLFVVDSSTVGRFTGLHDKNGKEIYEGDIVLVSDWTSIYASDYKGTVCFERGQWVVSYEKYGCEMTPRLFFDDFSDRKTTITGNIHELSKELWQINRKTNY